MAFKEELKWTRRKEPNTEGPASFTVHLTTKRSKGASPGRKVYKYDSIRAGVQFDEGPVKNLSEVAGWSDGTQKFINKKWNVQLIFSPGPSIGTTMLDIEVGMGDSTP